MTDTETTPGIPITEYMQGHKDGITKGRKTERERIIAYLRKNNDSCCHAGDNFADDIERGEHE